MTDDGLEDWLNAADAVEYTITKTGSPLVNQILERARDGLVSARAHHFIVDGPETGRPTILTPKTLDGFIFLPKEFFWAGSGHALTTDWVSGDFKTWINNRWECRAYGVEFRTADVAPMCPQYAPRGVRSKHTHSKHTNSEMEQWMTEAPTIKADDAFRFYRLDARYNGIKQEEFRKLWKQIKGTTQGRQPKLKA